MIALALTAGLICALILCGIRAQMESRDTGVSLIMSVEDVKTLAELERISYEEYSETLLSAGLSSIITPGEVCEKTNLLVGGDYEGEDAVVGLLEDNRQYSHLPIEGFEYSEDASVVRVFKLIPEYAARYATLGYDGPEEIENLTYRTITDRNVRVIWLCPFTHAKTGEVISAPNDYVSVIEGVGARIARHGLSLGQFSHFEGYTPNLWLIIGTILAMVAGGILLLKSLLPLRGKTQTVLLIGGFWICCIMWNVVPWLLPFAASVIFPCLGVWLTAELLVRVNAKTAAGAVIAYITILLCAFGTALFGGTIIAAMQSSRAFLLAVTNFRGVKLSQLLPLGYAAIICLKTFYRGKKPLDILREYKDSKKLALIILVLIALAAALYILRTGDGLLSAGRYEQLFRNWLENLLLVRPRTKEFLAAWPALALAVTLMLRGSRRYAWPCAIFTSVGLASIVNTFCHSRSPLWLSLSRSGMGLLLGGIIGIVVILVLFRKKPAQN